MQRCQNASSSWSSATKMLCRNATLSCLISSGRTRLIRREPREDISVMLPALWTIRDALPWWRIRSSMPSPGDLVNLILQKRRSSSLWKSPKTVSQGGMVETPSYRKNNEHVLYALPAHVTLGSECHSEHCAFFEGLTRNSGFVMVITCHWSALCLHFFHPNFHMAAIHPFEGEA